MKTTDFISQNRVGKDGEEFFAKHYKEYKPIKQEVDRRYDMILSHPHPITKHTKVEIKVDTHDTGNVFIEYYTERKDGTRYNGGPWKAKEINADIIYVLSKYETISWFDSVSLCKFIEDKNYKLVQRGHNVDGRFAMGYQIPVKDLEDGRIIIEKVKVGVNGKKIKIF